jgi:hypothetical protein
MSVSTSSTPVEPLEPQGAVPLSAFAKLLVQPDHASKMMKYAMYLMKGHVPNAEDLVGDTTVAAIKQQSGEHAWKGPPPPLVKWLGSVMNGVLSNRRRKAKHRITLAFRETEDGATDHAEEARLAAAEEQAHDQEQEELMAELRAYFTSQPKGHIAIAILDCAEEGIDKSEVIAARAGCKPNEVYDAKDRLKYRMDRLRMARAAAKADAP